MLNKNVCPKCGQLYDTGMDKCPLCGQPAQTVAPTETPVQRHRLTEVERRQRQQEQRRDAAEARRKEREARRAADAEEERQLEEAEERERLERKRKRLERHGLSDEEIVRKLGNPEQGTTMDDGRSYDRGKIPTSFLMGSIVLSLLALIIGCSFLLWRAQVLPMPLYDQLNKAQPAATEQQEQGCTKLVLSAQTLELTAAGQTYSFLFERQPETCALPVSFQSSDPAVVTVGELGIVTAIGHGEATITATCGDATATCLVTCSFEEVATTLPEELDLSGGLTLSDTDITFFNPSESIYLHVTNVPADTEVFWVSSNEEVATVEQNGHVVAVGKGTCYITAVVEDVTESCIVRCDFSD